MTRESKINLDPPITDMPEYLRLRLALTRRKLKVSQVELYNLREACKALLATWDDTFDGELDADGRARCSAAIAGREVERVRELLG